MDVGKDAATPLNQSLAMKTTNHTMMMNNSRIGGPTDNADKDDDDFNFDDQEEKEPSQEEAAQPAKPLE